MLLFASRNTKTLTIQDGDPPRDVEVLIAALPRRHRIAAARNQQMTSIADLKEIGGPAFVKELQAMGDKKVKKAIAADPLMQFDVEILLKFGVKSIDGKPADQKTIDDIGDEAAEYIAREVLRLTKPSLLVVVLETSDGDDTKQAEQAEEIVRGEGSGSSIAI